jgi:hypothetical protein
MVDPIQECLQRNSLLSLTLTHSFLPISLLSCARSLRQMVDLIQECLHETEDSTLYVPAALAKMAYGPVEAIRRKVRGGHLCVCSHLGFEGRGSTAVTRGVWGRDSLCEAG